MTTPSTWWTPWRATLALAAVGFLINCQPSEPFLSEYLQEDKGLTEEQLDNAVWPADTYASFAMLLPIGLLAESVGYARTVALGLLCRELTRVVLIYASGLGWMVTMQVTYAIATDVDTVFFALVYRVVPTSHYEVATGVLLGAYHAGNVLGAALGQILRSHAGSPLRDLFYASWAFTTLGLAVFALCRPPQRGGESGRAEERASNVTAVGLGEPDDDGAAGGKPLEQPSDARSSITEHLLPLSAAERHAPMVISSTDKGPMPPSLVAELRARGWRSLLAELRGLYASHTVRRWSLWWVFGVATHTLFGNYYQTLFGHFFTHVDYGWLEVLLEVGAVVGSLVPLLLRPHAPRARMLVAVPGAALTVGMVLSVLVPQPQVLLYTWTVAIAALTAALRSWASVAIAEHMPGLRFALVFTVNTFFALLVATVGSAVLSGLGGDTLAYYWLAVGLALVPVVVVSLGWPFAGDADASGASDAQLQTQLEAQGHQEQGGRGDESVRRRDFLSTRDSSVQEPLLV